MLLHMDTARRTRFLLKDLEENCPEFTNNCIVECDYDDEADTYRPIKVRNDKTHPNQFLHCKKDTGKYQRKYYC